MIKYALLKAPQIAGLLIRYSSLEISLHKQISIQLSPRHNRIF